MTGIVALIFLISIIFVIIGLIKPGMVVRWGKPERRSRKGVLMTYGLVAAVSFMIFIAIPPAPRTDIVADTTHQTTPKRTANNSNAVTDSKPSRQSNVDDLTVSDVDFTQEGYAGYITGVVKNNTNHAYRYVEVDINIYDESGAQTASPLANTQNLQAGGTWRFKAPIIPRPQGQFRYKVVKVTGRK